MAGRLGDYGLCQCDCSHAQGQITDRLLLPTRIAYAGRASWMASAAAQGCAKLCREVDEEHISILEESARATQEGAPAQPSGGLRQKVMQSVADLQAGLLERETEVSSPPCLNDLKCPILTI